MTSRQVVLTATFLALAAGGTAACDTATDDEMEPYSSFDDSGDTGYSTDSSVPDDEEEQTGDEVFYCADEDGEIVDDDECADGGTSSFFLWHSSGYARGLKPGTSLKGGDYFLPGDRAARRAFKLPATGKVGNGTVKTNIVGRSSGSGSSGGGSTSSGDSDSGSTLSGGSGFGSGSSGG